MNALIKDSTHTCIFCPACDRGVETAREMHRVPTQ
jgi:hypothetical protein